MISLETLTMVRDLLAAQTLLAGGPELVKAAESVTAALGELDRAINAQLSATNGEIELAVDLTEGAVDVS